MSEDREWKAGIKEIGDKIVALTLLEAKELSDYLKDVYGIEPASGGAVMVAAPAAGAGEAADAGPALLDVVLKGVPDTTRKISVIKAVREITGLGLKEAKDLVEKAPSPIKEKVDKDTADKLKAQLVEAGGDVELK